MLVYKIAGVAEWASAQAAGAYNGSPVDLADGFIHLSSAEQAPETAAKWYSGRHDLILIAVDAELAGAALRWEPSRGGDLFPHLYGPLGAALVKWTRALPLGAGGRHEFGDLSA